MQTPIKLMLQDDHPFGIHVRNLKIASGRKVILSVQEMVLPKLGIVAIMGPSGCGKSSLLRSLANLHDDSVRIDGVVDVRCCREEKSIPISRFAMIWQQPTVFPCSIWDNLKVPLRKRAVPKNFWMGRMEAVLERTGLLPELEAKWWKQSAERLSGGQKQRLCIAMGLLKESDIILFDEPTSALDPVASEKIEKIISVLGREKLVLMVTHSIGQARRLSEYTAMFCTENSVGTLCEFGPTEQVLKQPVSAQGRAFIVRETGL